MSNEEKKSAFKRELVNQYLTYEQFIWFTARYYSQLQQEGKLDIVSIIEQVEGVSEAEALVRCIGIMSAYQMQHVELVELCRQMMSQDPDLNALSDQVKQN